MSYPDYPGGKRGARNGSEIRQWPAAALAFHYGARAATGRLAGYQQIKGISDA